MYRIRSSQTCVRHLKVASWTSNPATTRYLSATAGRPATVYRRPKGPESRSATRKLGADKEKYLNDLLRLDMPHVEKLKSSPGLLQALKAHGLSFDHAIALLKAIANGMYGGRTAKYAYQTRDELSRVVWGQKTLVELDPSYASRSGADAVGAPMTSPAFVELLCALGQPCLEFAELRELGKYTLDMACEGGDVSAAVALVVLQQYGEERYTAPPSAWGTIRKSAEKREDWRAMLLEANRLASGHTYTADTEKAYELSKIVFERTQPGQYIDMDSANEPRIADRSPWRVLQKLSLRASKRYTRPEDNEVLGRAIRSGAEDYEDPLASLWLARDEKAVEPSSERWLNLMTKAAMAGQPRFITLGMPYSPNAAEELGQYYLELHGWYPCRPSTKKEGDLNDPEVSMGFDWLHVGAHHHAANPTSMVRPYLKIASIMKEHGFSEQGLAWLSRGETEIEELGAGDTGISNEYRRAVATAVTRMEESIKLWDDPRFLKTEVLFGETVRLRQERIAKEKAEEEKAEKR